MTLPQAAARRQLKHRRQIDVQVSARGHGLCEADALLTDVKTRDAHLACGVRLYDPRWHRAAAATTPSD